MGSPGGKRPSMTSAQGRGMRLQLSDLDAKLRQQLSAADTSATFLPRPTVRGVLNKQRVWEDATRRPRGSRTRTRRASSAVSRVASRSVAFSCLEAVGPAL